MSFTIHRLARPVSWRSWGVIFTLCLALALGLHGVGYTQTQTFNSGSTGADGALNLTTPGTILFNPPNMTPPLNPAIPNVFNFTTINIAAGVNVQLSGAVFNAPVYWLATGAVEIDGSVLLNGANGHSVGSSLAQRLPSVPGPGGYAGGVGGTAGSNQLAESGNGPGGGAAGSGTANGGDATNSFGQDPIPLLGGSGGGGGLFPPPAGGQFGSGGGAGGGAVVIASSVSITLTGSINADGGSAGGGCGPCGGAGSGGVIRLIAPVITLSTGLGVPNAFVSAVGGNASFPAGNGLIRIEAFQLTFPISGAYPASVQSMPFPVLAPITPPSAIQVASIAGTPINANPFTFPNSTINSSAPVPVVIQAQYVPPGTTPTLYIFSESGPDQIISVPAPGLTGTMQSSTVTVNVTFPPGGSNGFVKAVWNNGVLTNAIPNPKAKR